MTIGFIGTGDIAAPMVRFLARKGHPILVSERNAKIAQSLAEAFDTVGIAPNQDVLDQADIVFLCVRPYQAAAALAPLRFRADQTLISVMAGVAMADLADLCAPATDIAMTIPLAFLERGGCPLPVYPDCPTLRALFAPDNVVLAQDSEAQLNRHFAASAVLGTMMDFLDQAGDWLGGDENAQTYVAMLAAGALRDVPKTGLGNLAHARDALATEGTLNLQLVTHLRQAGLQDDLKQGLDALAARLAG